MKNDIQTTPTSTLYGLVALFLLAVVVFLPELWARIIAAALYLGWVLLMGTFVQER